MSSTPSEQSVPQLVEITTGGAVRSAQSMASGPVLLNIESQDDLSQLFAAVERDEAEEYEKLAGGEPAAGVERTTREGDVTARSASGDFWLNGDVVLCGCPDCQAPMTVRIWLMIADCWNCGTSIELSQEQEREVRDLIAKREAAASQREPQPSAGDEPTARRPAASAQGGPAVAAATALASPTTQAAGPAAQSGTQQAADRPSTSAVADSQPAPPPTPARRLRRQRIAAASPNTVRRRLQTAQARSSTAWISELLKQTPAWLISLVFHLVALTLLGLLPLPREDRGPTILLSTAVSRQPQQGGDVVIEDPTDDVQFDLPIPAAVRIDDPQVRDAMIRADQDARELRIDPDTTNPHLPDLQVVKQQLNQSGRSVAALAARDPRIRVEMVKQEGGTTLTEAAVARGLRWLAQHQNTDGSWSLHDGGHNCACDFRGLRTDAGGTALALLPFLGAGQTHLVGRYKSEVAKGLRYMLDHQKPDGDLRHDAASSNAGMYVHGQAAIVLCEAYMLSGDEQLRQAAQKAVDFIVEAQHPAGGWRYRPGEAGDTSVVGWQLMALQSAKAAKLAVPDFTLDLANQFLDSVESLPNFEAWRVRWAPAAKRAGLDELSELLARPTWGRLDIRQAERLMNRDEKRIADSGELSRMRDEYERLQRSHGTYAYQPNRSPTHVMTAEALLCRMYLGWKLEDSSLSAGIDHLIENYLPEENQFNIYYFYYGTQAMHHVGGERWDTWNSRMRDILVATQRKDGHPAGSWNPNGPHASGGRLYVTALAICTLEVYYRHLPVFRQIDLQ